MRRPIPRFDRAVQACGGRQQIGSRRATAPELPPHGLDIEIAAGDLQRASHALKSVTDRFEVTLRRPVVVGAEQARVLALGSSQVSGQALPVESLRKQGHDVLRGLAGACGRRHGLFVRAILALQLAEPGVHRLKALAQALKIERQHVVGEDPAELFPAFVERGTKWLQSLRGMLHRSNGRRVDPLRLGPCHLPGQ